MSLLKLVHHCLQAFAYDGFIGNETIIAAEFYCSVVFGFRKYQKKIEKKPQIRVLQKLIGWVIFAAILIYRFK